MKKNGIEFRGSNPDSSPNIEMHKNDSSFNSNLDSESNKQKNISHSNKLNMDNIRIYKSFNNNIKDSDSEEDKEQKYFERKETGSLKSISKKMNNNSENNNSSIRMSIPKDINDNYSSRKNIIT